MKDSSIPPFELGGRVRPNDLIGWVYTGLSGRPGESGAARRYVKGQWVLEVAALADRKRSARIVALRTQTDDEHWWAEKAAR